MEAVERFLDRHEIDHRIEQHRKGDCRIRVESKDRSAEVYEVIVRQKRHAFLFGCNAFGWGKMETRKTKRFEWNKQETNHNFDPYERVEGHGRDYGDGRDPDDAWYTSLFRRVFNLAVLPFYERAIEPIEGTVNYHRVGRMIDWAQENQLKTKGHPLLYRSRLFSAQWLLDKGGKDYWAFMERRIREILDRFEERVDLWDYANEIITFPLPDCPTLYEAASRAYRIARDAAPNAVLTLNDDYGLEERVDMYIDVLQRMKGEGDRPDVLGIQGHYWSINDDIRRKLVEALDKYEQLDIPIHFTENTFAPVPSPGVQLWEAEAQQARDTVEFYRYLFSRPQVEALIWWDFCDRHSFCNIGGLLRDDLTMKPAYQALDHLINQEWHTELSLSFRQGETGFRGFYGSYEAEIVLANGTRLYRTFELSKGTDEVLIQI